MTQCPNCGAGVRGDSSRCVKCGSMLETVPAAPAPAAPGYPAAGYPPPAPVGSVPPLAAQRNPAISGLLSLLIPGAGQLYNGQLVKAIVCFVAAAVLWGFCLGWIVNVAGAIEAAVTAQRINRGVHR